MRAQLALHRRTERLSHLFIAGFLALSVGARAEEPPFVVALVVGLNASRDPQVAPLKYADDDAARYAELLGGIADKVVLLTVLDADTQTRHPEAATTSRPPSRVELDRAVAMLAETVRAATKAGRRTEFFFVYAGHGALTAEREGSVTLLDGVLLRRDLFRAVLDPVPADFKHVIIDACDAYFMVAKRGANATPAELNAMKSFLDKEALDGHPEVGVLISGSREVQTHEWSAIEAGVFSHEVRSALLGAADADGDGLLRYAEIAAFVTSANEGLSDARARVEVYARAPQLDLAHPVIDLRRGPRRFVELPTTLKGRVTIEDGRGARYADVNVSGESAVYLRLVGNDDYFLFREDREARVPYAVGISSAPLAIFSERRKRARGAVEDDLRKGLFSVPYGLGFVRGFVASNPQQGAMPAPSSSFPDATLVRSEVNVTPPGSVARRMGWVSLGAAVAFGAGSAVSAVFARNSYDAFLQRLAVEGQWTPSSIGEVENFRLATNLLLAGAIAAGATGVLLLWLSDAPSGAKLAIGPGPDFSFTVRF